MSVCAGVKMIVRLYMCTVLDLLTVPWKKDIKLMNPFESVGSCDRLLGVNSQLVPLNCNCELMFKIIILNKIHIMFFHRNRTGSIVLLVTENRCTQ